jgi:MFS family permease
MLEPRKLLTFELLGLCVVTFVAVCNVTVFYNLFNYLQTLGIPANLQGLLVGSYSLTAMVLYLLVSPFLSPANAPRNMLLGMMVVALCGMSYLFVHSFWGLLGLRMMNGVGHFLMGAGAMTLFVSVIPKEKSGQAFAVYSVAILLPYGAVPAVMDALVFLIPTPPHGYAAATVTLIPAAWIVWHIRRRLQGQLRMEERKHLPAWSDIRANVTQLRVALLLLLNTIYIINWSSMFFLIKGFADQQGIINVGSFFTVQTGMMIVFRLFAGRLFDTFDKARMVVATFAVIALGHLALDNLPGAWAIPLVALIFGVGMGMGQPIIHGLMFEISSPSFRPLNANLILFSTQAAFFLGPVLGGAVVVRWDYHGYFLFSIGLALAAASLGIFLAGKRQDILKVIPPYQ